MPQSDIRQGDALTLLREIPSGSVRCCVTSPPYWGLRDYGHAGQLGLEKTPDAYVARMVEVFREVRRVLADDGTLWLNLGDSYAGSGPSGASYQSETTKRREGIGIDGAFRISKTLGERGLTYAEKKPIPPPGLKPKDLVGIPWRVAFALQADGWWLRSDIIWAKPNPMPESVTDRPTKAHEYLFLLSKSQTYYYDAKAIAEPTIGKNHHDVTGTGTRNVPGQTDNTGNRKYENPNNGRNIQTTNSESERRNTVGTFNNNPRLRTNTTRNKRTVWTITPKPFKGAHFAVMPEALVEPCVLAGSAPGDTVLDPFAGSGTVGVVAKRHGRDFVGCELNPEYAEMARSRISNASSV